MGYFDSVKPKPPPVNGAPVKLDIVGEGHAYALAALRGEAEQVAAATEGTRNDTLNRAWFRLGRHVGAGTIDADTVRAALADAARAAGLPQTEIDTVLRVDSTSALHAGTAHPRHPTPLDPAPAVTVLDDPAGDDEPPVNPIIDWHELFSADDDGEEWIVEPLLPARRMVALYSAPKAGKSILMLEIAVAIARGGQVIGTTVDTPRRVLYVDFENDPRGDIRTRLEAMDVGPHDLDNLCYLTYPSLAKFDTPQGAVDLIRHVEHYRCEIVVIDTVSRSVAGEENDNDTWLAFYRHTGLALKQARVACIRLDHSGKDRDKGMRGGSAKYGDVDAVWRLTLLNENTVHLECTDNRMPVPVRTITLVREDMPLTHRMMGDSWQLVADLRTREVDQLLDDLKVPCQASVREATKALREAGHRAENRAIRAAVKLRKLRLDVPISEPAETTFTVTGERIVPAWDAAMRMLADGAWHLRGDVIQRMLNASDVVAKTCSNRLHEAIAAGVLEQRGEYPNQEVRTFPESVPGTPAAHPGTPEGSVPGTGVSLDPVRHTSAAVPGTPSHGQEETPHA